MFMVFCLIFLRVFVIGVKLKFYKYELINFFKICLEFELFEISFLF